MVTIDLRPIVGALNHGVELNSGNSHSGRNSHEPVINRTADSDAGQALGERVTRVNAFNPYLVIGVVPNIKLKSPESEPGQSNSPFRQQGWAKGVSIIDHPMVISILPGLWAESGDCGPARTPKNRWVVEQSSEVGVAYESFVLVTDVHVIADIKLILVIRA